MSVGYKLETVHPTIAYFLFFCLLLPHPFFPTNHMESKNIFFARFLVGVFNGIIGTSRTVLGDISDDTNQAFGIVILSVGWGNSFLLGPAIGGYLSEPAKKYPLVFSDHGIFAK